MPREIEAPKVRAKKKKNHKNTQGPSLVSKSPLVIANDN
jgi:hypothetical protein